ncbi:hypothetical protein J5Y09_03980 [Roseomonas sp. PWR1]|uniref:Uncharacterized protein n=1 Tax=Roseomonas nitratireducens TaxID=2820810 RepID=A0ABS4ANW3_9PROT|nr:hypothetical protein [Neoroseomonas nitratireducens]MBP0463059.1 hypothetical protein [Neoroseomonas nitratireducens]
MSEVSAALDALARRLAQQQQAAVAVCGLAVRAEEIAASARRLAYGAGGGAAEADFIGELEEFSADLRRAVDLAAQDALTGKAVAKALLQHVTTIDTLARDVDSLDVATVRARLRPLAVTLAEIPATQQASDTRKAELLALAERAEDASAKAVSIAKARPGARRDMMLEVARSVATLAEDVAVAAVAFGKDADMAAKAAEVMMGRTQMTKPAPENKAADTIGAVVRALNGEPVAPGERIDWGVRSR